MSVYSLSSLSEFDPNVTLSAPDRQPQTLDVSGPLWDAGEGVHLFIVIYQTPKDLGMGGTNTHPAIAKWDGLVKDKMWRHTLTVDAGEVQFQKGPATGIALIVEYKYVEKSVDLETYKLVGLETYTWTHRLELNYPNEPR